MFLQIKSAHIFKTLNLLISTFFGSFKIVLVSIYSFNYIQVLEAFYNLKFVFNPESSFQYTAAAAAAAAKSLQLCLTLCDPIDGSPPGSPVPGILQARTLEWVAIFFSNA